MQTSPLLFLRSHSPFPARGGADIRDINIIRALSELFPIHILCFQTPDAEQVDPTLKNVSVEFISRESTPVLKKVLYPVRPYVVNGFSESMKSALEKKSAEGFKTLWISRLAMAQYIPAAKNLGFKVILDEHNVESHLLFKASFSSLKTLPTVILATQCAFYERSFCQQSDLVVATSDIDASRLHKLAPGAKIKVIPSSVDSQLYQNARTQIGNSLLFSGALNYYPNVQGILWFVRKVLPRLRAALRNKCPPMVVAGSNPSRELIEMLREEQVEIHPNPESMIPHLSEAAVVIVPLLQGSGTRLKILEAMASARAVISTSKGAEGLILSPGYDIFIADDADAFASGILRLIRSPEIRKELGDHAAETVEERYDWQCMKSGIQNLLESQIGS
jgi:polysaccharide biosynthesis protein PslH